MFQLQKQSGAKQPASTDVLGFAEELQTPSGWPQRPPYAALLSLPNMWNQEYPHMTMPRTIPHQESNSGAPAVQSSTKTMHSSPEGPSAHIVRHEVTSTIPLMTVGTLYHALWLLGSSGK